ncbi:hypothetical protein RSOLAG1IB_10037 [Rhizoctonia solani AG-1 IB]|uniref:Kex protein n=1 Tax=Thanatephorus cucumeris (strain AG1-IB / isolate 7/3/14) TaxID=1108050 RepID=A0A0B7FUR1_THACB|nr:hypothetical protein RSOLAG1IB_10037 [Rhizoctonia solani AG-1 IB]
MDTLPHLQGLSLTLLGRSREAPIRHPIARAAVTGGKAFKRFMTGLLFRRVRPVETRLYASTRNSFAILAMGVLCFRTITAFLQAQNQIGSRMASAVCNDRAFPLHNIGILMERPVADSRWNASSLEDIDITVSASWRHSRRGYEAFDKSNCTVTWSRYAPGNYFGSSAGSFFHNLTIELFGCPSNFTSGLRNYPQMLQQPLNSDIAMYHIEIRSRVPGGQILYDQMPFVWLVNSNELPSNFSDISENSFEVRDYTPPWELLRGSHIEAEAKLITRRFISSSIMKDVILNSEPAYRPLSIYPIAESSVAVLNSSDASSASVTISVTLTPGLMYLRSQADRDNHLSNNICDFIDDYRSGTILDVIGSVGGLFALLQAAHMILFGRPLFWGLTGSKLITPFGLLGACSSKGFKRRLREEYHTRSTEEGPETIQIVKFLRDFVIEFGPADLETENRPLQQRDEHSSLANKDGIADRTLQIPPKRVDSDTSTMCPEENKVDDVV